MNPADIQELPIKLTGNTQGLKASPLRRLERLGNRRTHAETIVTPELARALTEVSLEIQRQVGVLIDRRGDIKVVLVGDARSVFIPDLSAYRRGHTRLCGLRLVHTHLGGESLTDDDLTDLALLRLDFVTAIEVLDSGLPGAVYSAHLLPDNAAEEAWEVLKPTTVHQLGDDFLEQVDALEDEFARTRAQRPAGDNRDRAMLIHVSEEKVADQDDSLAELAELARSSGIEVVQTICQRRKVDPKFVIGKGKLKSAVIKAMQLGVEMLVFDLTLSPSQLSNLANFTDLKVVDRTQVILDIFAQRAVTREGKIQVELAQLRYILPKLGMKQTESAFSRLTGGIGSRGPGETKLEIDRRRVTDRINQLEREVKKLGGRRRLRRGMRSRRELPVVSIVGYTNAGKSTLLNQITQSDVVAQDVLFATLNPVSRRLRFPHDREIIITDTVGFIRSLPKELMAAFRTTLEELNEADVLLHVLNAASPQVEEQFTTTMEVIHELGLSETPCILALNKADQADPEILAGLQERYGGLPTCALDRPSLRPLLDEMERVLFSEAVLSR